MKYVDSEKLIAEIERRMKCYDRDGCELNDGKWVELVTMKHFIESLQQEPRFPQYNNIVDKVFGAGNLESFEYDEAEMLVALAKEELLKSLQQEQPNNMIQWTGHNLKEVINFTGKSPKFGKWFKSWDELESYVHSHGDILKLFSDDGSHYEVPIGAWIVKTPDGYNVPSVARFIHAKQEQPQLPGIEEPGIPGKDFIPVEWVDACEMYGKWKIVKQEQPEVDLEKEIKNYLATKCAGDDEPSVSEIARHFYGLRNRALEEAAQHVYESWMDGTMDDVRRDMAELGKVLSARKE